MNATSSAVAAGETAAPENAGGETQALYASSETWSKDVWEHVKTHYTAMAQLKPLTIEEGAQGTVLTGPKFESEMTEKKEIRNYVGNIAALHPTACSMEDEEAGMDQIHRAARFRFYNQATGQWEATALWPADSNIPIARFTSVQPKKEEVLECFAKDHLKQAYWYAMAQICKALKNCDKDLSAAQDALKSAQEDGKVNLKAKVEELEKTQRKLTSDLNKFKRLGRMALFDYKYFANQEEKKLATFQSLERVEENRERWGFTGIRKVKMVVFAVDVIAKKADFDQRKGVQDADVHQYLKQAIRWQDDKMCPSAAVVAQLRKVGVALKEIPSLAIVIRACEEWLGRHHVFDDYRKVILLSLIHI